MVMADPIQDPLQPSALEAAKTVGQGLERIRRHNGGMARPWVKTIPRMPDVLHKTDGAVLLWEEGAKNTVDVKREIQFYLKNGYTLIEVLDSKRAERPNDPTWWPDLMEVLRWCESDIAFARMLDNWNHAHQLEISERIKHDVLNAEEEGADPKLLKVKVDYATKMLPRLVNKGLVERIEVDQTIRGTAEKLQHMPDDALRARALELAANPKVRKIMSLHMGDAYQPPPPAAAPPSAQAPSETIHPGAHVIDVEPDLDIPEAP